MEITSGIGNCAVTRLRKATKLLGLKHKELWSKLDNVTAPTSNYKNYRILSKDIPSLPILAVVQRDLLFMYEGNPDYLPAPGNPTPGHGEQLINMDKMRMVGSTIQDFVHHVQRNAPVTNITPKKKIRRFLKNAPFLSNEALYQQSLICEPSHTTQNNGTIWDDDPQTPITPRIPGTILLDPSKDNNNHSSEEEQQTRSRQPSDSSSWTPSNFDVLSDEDATPVQPHPMDSDSSYYPFEISPFTSPRKD
jgi:hypothetical protein